VEPQVAALAQAELLRSLGEPVDGCRAELISDDRLGALKSACAEDRKIWAIYANNFGPDGFDESIAYYRSNPRNRTFALFEGDDVRVLLDVPGVNREAVRDYFAQHGLLELFDAIDKTRRTT